MTEEEEKKLQEEVSALRSKVACMENSAEQKDAVISALKETLALRGEKPPTEDEERKKDIEFAKKLISQKI